MTTENDSKSTTQADTTQDIKDESDSVFMRNLSYDSNEEDLKAFIEENFGKTKYCLICRNKETGDSKGTAFAKFENAEDAAKCLLEFKDFEMQHKFHFDGRNIIVLPVIPRDQVHEVKQNREKEVVKQERHKRRERLIKERVLAKQRQRRPPFPSSKGPHNKTNPVKRKNNNKKQTNSNTYQKPINKDKSKQNSAKKSGSRDSSKMRDDKKKKKNNNKKSKNKKNKAQKNA